MKISFLSSFYPYSSEFTDGNNFLYHALEKSAEIKAFNYSLLYPDLLFPGKELEMQAKPSEVLDIIENYRVLNTINPASYYLTSSAVNATRADFFLTRCWNSYLTAALGSVGKFIDKKHTKRFAIVDSLYSDEKIPFEAKSINLFINNYDAFIVFNKEVKDNILSVNKNAIIVEHPIPFTFANEERINKNIARKMLNIPSDKRTLLFYGTIRHYKGIEIIFEALSRLDDNYRLIIAGNSPSGYDYYKRKINDWNITQKVHLIERTPNINEIPYIFAAADVLLMPYSEDYENIDKTWTNTIFSYELPVIVSDVSNFREIIEAKQFGIIIEKNNCDNLINAINRYYDEQLEQKFLDNIQNLRYSHSWQSLATIIFDLFENLTDKEDATLY